MAFTMGCLNKKSKNIFFSLNINIYLIMNIQKKYMKTPSLKALIHLQNISSVSQSALLWKKYAKLEASK